MPPSLVELRIDDNPEISSTKEFGEGDIYGNAAKVSRVDAVVRSLCAYHVDSLFQAVALQLSWSATRSGREKF